MNFRGIVKELRRPGNHNLCMCTDQDGNQWQVSVPKNTYLYNGAEIRAYGRQTSPTGLQVDEPPLVLAQTDKSALIHHFQRLDLDAESLYEQLTQDNNASSEGLFEEITKLVASYYKDRSNFTLQSIMDYIHLDVNQAKKLVKYWNDLFTYHSIRALRLKKSWVSYLRNYLQSVEIYYLCLTNPFILPTVDVEIAQWLLDKQGREVTLTMKRCSEIIQGMVLKTYGRNDKWMSCPTWYLSNQYPSFFADIMETLIHEARLKLHHDKEDFLYLPLQYKVEKVIAQFITQRMEQTPCPQLELNWEPRPNQDQVNAVRGALSHSISIITGGAGTGKTFTVSKIIRILQNQGIRVVATAYTGKAVARIRDSLSNNDIKTQTMHKFLRSKEDVFDCVVLDEASMIPPYLFYQFIRKFPEISRIIFVGDVNQLPPIQYGSLFTELVQVLPIFELKINERVRKNGPSFIIQNAQALINKGPFPKPGHDFFVRPGGIETVHATIHKLHSEGTPIEKLMVIVPTNSDRKELNRFIQEVYQLPRRTEQVGKKVFREGDRVIMLKNNYLYEIMNGDIGIIERITDGLIHVIFDNGNTAEFLIVPPKSVAKQNDELKFDDDEEDEDEDEDLTTNQLDLAYALTVHKAQGSEYPIVITHFRYFRPDSFLTRNMLYTAITRPSEQLYLIADSIATNDMKRRDEKGRFSNLAQLVREHELS